MRGREGEPSELMRSVTEKSGLFQIRVLPLKRVREGLERLVQDIWPEGCYLLGLLEKRLGAKAHALCRKRRHRQLKRVKKKKGSTPYLASRRASHIKGFLINALDRRELASLNFSLLGRVRSG